MSSVSLPDMDALRQADTTTFLHAEEYQFDFGPFFPSGPSVAYHFARPPTQILLIDEQVILTKIVAAVKSDQGSGSMSVFFPYQFLEMETAGVWMLAIRKAGGKILDATAPVWHIRKPATASAGGKEHVLTIYFTYAADYDPARNGHFRDRDDDSANVGSYQSIQWGLRANNTSLDTSVEDSAVEGESGTDNAV